MEGKRIFVNFPGRKTKILWFIYIIKSAGHQLGWNIFT